MTAFMDDVVFPTAVSRGSIGGPDWLAEITRLSSGHEERNTPWSAPLHTYDAKYGVRFPAELHQIKSLYLVARARLYGFRFLDWTDYRSGSVELAPAATDQALGTGDGEATAFPLVKRYEFAGHTFDRRIAKPFGTVLVAVDGTPVVSGFTADLATGIVTFDAAPAADAELTWGGTFHVPVRFDGKLDLTTRGPIGDIPSIFLQELRL